MSKKKSLLDLPQTQDSWYFLVHKLRLWITPDEGEPQRPYISMVVNLQTGMIHGQNLGFKPSPREVQKLLFESMLRPEKVLEIPAQRPLRIFFEEREWLEALAPALQQIGVQAKHRSLKSDFAPLIQEMEEHLRQGSVEPPALLAQKGVNVRLLASLFAAAADFYRAEPWVQLSNSDLLAVRVAPQKEPYYVTVMGQGGVEYGLAVYQTWEDVLLQHRPVDRVEEALSASGVHVFFYNPIHEVPFDDLDAIETYGWELAGPQAYPVPYIFTAEEEVQRPGREELLWYEAALRAIPQFVSEHLAEASHAERGNQDQPIEASLAVNTSAGRVQVQVRYPGGELEAGSEPVHDDLNLFDQEEHQPGGPPFDRRAMEGQIAHLLGDRGGAGLEGQARRAQEVMYQAWDESNPALRISLAHKALKISPDCADAYVLLAEEEADTVQRALELYQKGVIAGRRALGEDYFEENVGYFWGLLETRPYMRAMQGKASCLWQMGRRQEAIDIYSEMMRLNPGDNQGIRYVLVDLLLALNRDADLAKLLRQYKEDASAVWRFTRALLEFRKAGASTKANRLLQDALEFNPYVLPYLRGKKRIPNRLPDYIGFGDENEAIEYAANHLNYWRRTPGALDWLQKQADALGPLLAGKESGGTPLASPDKGEPPARKKSKRRTRSGLKIGDTVQVQAGVKDPDYGIDLSGWQGEVTDLDEDEQGNSLLLVEWDSQTLESMPDEEIEKSEEDGLDWSKMYLLESEVKRAEQRDTPQQRQASREKRAAQFPWAYLGEQGRRIQAVLQAGQERPAGQDRPAGQERPGVDPEDEWAAFQAWDAHLRQHMQLPFTAEVSEPVEVDWLEVNDRVKVVAFEALDESWGVQVRAAKGKQQASLALYALEFAAGKKANKELLDDYLTWYIGH
jgi:tetratricopeptide (TPR) repeat protein